MRGLFKALLMTGIVVAGLAAQDHDGPIATIVPASPKIGETVTVTYNPMMREAAMKRPSALSLHTLILSEIGSIPTLVETPMNKSGEVWKASFTLQNKNARFLLFRFVAGDLIDENVDRGWDALVVGGDGKPLEGGLYWRGAVAAFGGYMGFKHSKDLALANTAIDEEHKRFPRDQYALNLKWYLLMNPTPTDAAKARVKKELVGALKTFRNSEEALPMLLVWLEQTGQTSEADSLRMVLVHESPRGAVASAMQAREISRERDQAKRARLLEAYIHDFPMKPEELLGNQRLLVTALVETGQYEKAHAVLASARGLDPSMYNSVASPFVEKGKDLEQAVKWLSEGINILQHEGRDSKPASSTVADWEKSRKGIQATLLSARGQAYRKLKDHSRAESDYSHAYSLTGGDDLSVNSDLIGAYVQSGKFREAEKLGLDCIAAGKSNLPIVENLKVAFVKIHGSLKGYDKSVQGAKKKRQALLLKKGLDKPAPEFALKNVEGSTVKLSDLRGRVVVLEVMASWCSSSRAALPQVQKVSDQYQYYRNVAFLALDSYESATGTGRESLVKKFMKDAPSTIPVLFDEGSTTAQQFGVEGIPMRYVIDQFGNIRFKSAGFSDGKQLTGELIDEIEALLNQ